MICSACSTEAPAESAFCPKCGQKFAGAEESPPAADSPVERIRQKAAALAAEDTGERKLWSGGFSPKGMIGHWLSAGVLSIAGVVVCVLFGAGMPTAWSALALVLFGVWSGLGLFYAYQRLGVQYELTSQRLIHKTGILARATNRIEVIDVDDVSVQQTFVERLFGVGTIRILSSDTSDPLLLMRGIDEVKKVSDLIDNARRDERRRRGMYIESV